MRDTLVDDSYLGDNEFECDRCGDIGDICDATVLGQEWVCEDCLDEEER
jgi:hypothetical protein